ncbi:MAG: phosphatidate cytidylyltransferase [Alphaproteobacteria bacterium]
MASGHSGTVPLPNIVVRTLTAAVVAPLTLAAAWQGGAVFAALVVAVALKAAHEWTRLHGGGWHDGQPAVFAAAPAAAVAALMAGGAAALATVLALAAAVALWAIAAGRPRARWSAAGILLLGLATTALLDLRLSGPAGLAATVWLLLAIWAADIGAYLAGRAIGGPLLAPRISPRKTWAGVGGGVAAAGIVGAAVAQLLGGGAEDVVLLALLAAVLAPVGQAGDLLMSLAKRAYGVKDYGAVLPGHGGVLDRIDSLLLVAPVAALLARLWPGLVTGLAA